MLKIRLMRIGAKKKPFYRVVVLDKRAKRTGAYIELLGTYNPLTEPKEIKLKQDRIDHWVKQGAQFSNGYLRIIGKAPQRPPRKPKKEKKLEESKAKAEVAQAIPEESKIPESQGEDDQKAQAVTSVTPSEPVPTLRREASLTDEQANIEPASESEKKDERPA